MANHTITLYTIYQEDDSGKRQTQLRGDNTINGDVEHSYHVSVASGALESSSYIQPSTQITGANLVALYVIADGTVTVSVNDVSTGSPDHSYSMTEDKYLIWHSSMLGATNPWSSTDVLTSAKIHVLNTSGSTVNVSLLALEDTP